MTVETGATIVKLVLKEVPPLITALRVLFSKGDPTDEDWNEFEALAKKSYDDYIKEAVDKLPPPASPS